MDLSDILQPPSTTALTNGAHDVKGDAMDLDDHPSAEAGPSRGRLVLPQWDIPPLKPLHASHDFLSLLNLAPLYNTYVRPYADPLAEPFSGGLHDGEHDDHPLASTGPGANGEPGEQGAGGGRRRGKRKKLERGYWPVLLEDIIDPVPMGEGNKSHRSLLPLIPDARGGVGGGMGQIEPWEGDIGMLGAHELEVAKLEVGSKVDGYGGGQKTGVKEAEDRRRRRKQRHSMSITTIPVPDAPGEETPGSAIDTGTPLLPVAPPSKPPFHIRNNSLSGASGLPPKPTFGGVPRPTGGPFTPTFPRKRPLDTPGGGGGSNKKSKGGPSRSASPMVPSTGGAAVPQGGQRLGVPKHGARARTEG